MKAYIEQTLKEAKEKGYVKTIFGRKRQVPEIKNPNSVTRMLGERLAVNSPVQGTAADIIKISMINLFDAFKSEGLKTKMILQVHDELVFESPGNEIEKACTIVKEKMEGAADLSVPLRAEIGYGKNWAEAHR